MKKRKQLTKDNKLLEITRQKKRKEKLEIYKKNSQQ